MSGATSVHVFSTFSMGCQRCIPKSRLLSQLTVFFFSSCTSGWPHQHPGTKPHGGDPEAGTAGPVRRRLAARDRRCTGRLGIAQPLATATGERRQQPATQPDAALCFAPGRFPARFAPRRVVCSRTFIPRLFALDCRWCFSNMDESQPAIRTASAVCRQDPDTVRRHPSQEALTLASTRCVAVGGGGGVSVKQACLVRVLQGRWTVLRTQVCSRSEGRTGIRDRQMNSKPGVHCHPAMMREVSDSSSVLRFCAAKALLHIKTPAVTRFGGRMRQHPAVRNGQVSPPNSTEQMTGYMS